MTSQKFHRYLRVFLLLLADYISVYGILVFSLFLYHRFGAKYSMNICLHFLPFPLVFIVINSFSRLYGGSIFYPGLGVNKIEELKRITINIAASYVLLFSYLAIMRNMERFSRFALLLSLAISIVIVPIFRHIVR